LALDDQSQFLCIILRSRVKAIFVH
jgi:hypothetical protein